MSIHQVDRPAPAQVPERPQPVPQGKVCTCGHQRAAHEHYRRGTDCALCGCAKYRKPFRLFGRG